MRLSWREGEATRSLSRIIKAAHVQFEGFALAHGGGGAVSSVSLALQQSRLDELEGQVLERLQAAEQQAAEMLAGAESRAKLILAQAEEQARGCVEAAKHEAAALAEEIKTRAYQQGYEEGTAQGLDDGRAQASTEIVAASQVLLAAQAAASDRLLQSETELVELAVAVARRILMHELTTTPEMAIEMAHQALVQLRETPRAVLRVCPDMLSLYRDHLEALRGDFREIVHLEMMADPMLSSGDFLIDTPSGTVDGRLDAQLGVLRKTLLTLTQERSEDHA